MFLSHSGVIGSKCWIKMICSSIQNKLLGWRIGSVRDKRTQSELYMPRPFVWKVCPVILMMARLEFN